MKKKLFAILLCLVLILSFAACGASDKATNEAINGSFSYSAESDFGAVADELKVEESVSSSDSGAGKNDVQEKIIKTVKLDIQTKEYEKYISALTSSVTSLGGYVENSTNYMGSLFASNSNRSSTYVVRIPADKLDEFISGAEMNGKIVSKTEEQKNVTLEYVDLESRINAYKTEQKTLTGLLEKADNLSDVLSIQERLSQVNYEIDTYTAQLRVLENRVSYSTVTLNINEVERVTEDEPSLGTEIKNTFMDNLEDLGEWLRDFVINFIGGLPVIIPVVAVIVIIILVLRKIIKKRKNK